jgi:hypothetical protein
VLSAGAITLAAAGSFVAAGPATAATQGPCDIYAAGGTPCVAAHSTTRALYGSYNGSLYQVQRSSDNATLNVGLLSVGGYANAAAQDSFCANTTCVITTIYDQSGKNNHLTRGSGHWSGPQPNGTDNLAYANAVPVTVAGHKVYGTYIAPGTGYHDLSTTGIATGDQPEGMYAIFDGTHFNNGCCFDYGNAETSGNDTGNGHMEAIYFGSNKGWGYGAGNGPWVMGDLENGLFSGVNRGFNANDPTVGCRFQSAILKGTSNQWALRGGNAQSGGLSTFYNGVRPNVSGYNPMSKEGAIILGIGGDNSIGAAGTFYEGVMTSGYPSDATENSVQANIVAAQYTTFTLSGMTAGSRISLRATTACCTGDYLRHNDGDTKVVIPAVSSSSSATLKGDATWIVRPGLANSSCVSFESANKSGQYLRHYGFQLYLNASDGSSLFNQDATFCAHPGITGQGVSLPSNNFSDHYLRHFDFTVYAATDRGTNTWDNPSAWAADVTWVVTSPWS